jgi:hypothetical protein
LAEKLNLNTLEHIDNAWDWLFSQQKCRQVLITLKDDTKLYGWLGENSLASADSNNRDIYLEYNYCKNDECLYVDNPESDGLYIPKDTIKFISFQKFNRETENE